jgi:ribonuclease P protein component
MASLKRLKRRAEFLAAQRSPHHVATCGVVVQLADSHADFPTRVGFTVSKKVGNAVIRNRVRRRLRAAAQEALATLGRPATDYVLIGRKAAIDRDFRSLIKDIRYATHQLHAAQDRRHPAPDA